MPQAFDRHLHARVFEPSRREGSFRALRCSQPVLCRHSILKFRQFIALTPNILLSLENRIKLVMPEKREMNHLNHTDPNKFVTGTQAQFP